MSRRYPVRGYAGSTLTAYAEQDWTEDAPEIEAVCAAFRAGDHRALVVKEGMEDQVDAGLTVLSNIEDAVAEDERRRLPRNRDVERARMARAAAAGLSTLALRVLRSGGAS